MCIVYISIGAFTCFHAQESLQYMYSAMVDSTFVVCVWGGWVGGMCICMCMRLCVCLFVPVCVCVCVCGCEIACPVLLFVFVIIVIIIGICLTVYTTQLEIKSKDKSTIMIIIIIKSRNIYFFLLCTYFPVSTIYSSTRFHFTFVFNSIL